MEPVVSSEQMRWCDETTISKAGIPGLLLMDRAGTAASHLILRRYSPDAGSVVAVVCGKGNNGGDGFVIARILAEQGLEIHVGLTAPASTFTGDAATQFGILRRLSRAPGSTIRITSFSSLERSIPSGLSLVVDAVFGTGFSGAPRGVPKRAIAWMSSLTVPVVAVDMPSGIDATRGTADGVHVTADMTVTFGLLKSGLLLNEGRENAGQVSCVDIGIPSWVTRKAPKDGYLLGVEDVRSLLPGRPQRIHKYSAGKVLVVAGSRGFTGAASLAAHAALRSGAGAVMLMVPEDIYPIMARKRTDEVVAPLASTPAGSFAADAAGSVLEKMDWSDTLVIGPGLSLTDDTRAFVETVLGRWRGPAVIDADALTIVASSGKLAGRLKERDWILTPHTGEFDRFVRAGSPAIEADRIGSVRRFVSARKCTLLLKGAPTVVARKGETPTINSTGNPGLATIGSGDVLAGCIGSLRAQGLASAEAARAGAWLHGRAGDLARDVLGERSVVASDILQYLPVALRECTD